MEINSEKAARRLKGEGARAFILFKATLVPEQEILGSSRKGTDRPHHRDADIEDDFPLSLVNKQHPAKKEGRKGSRRREDGRWRTEDGGWRMAQEGGAKVESAPGAS